MSIECLSNGRVVDSFIVPTRAQGKTGIGQGGWTSAMFQGAVGQPITVALRSPIPLEIPLVVTEVAVDHWQLSVEAEGRVILEGHPGPGMFATTEPVSVEAGADARSRFRGFESEHPAPLCFSCGIHPESMCVHNGPLLDDSGRFATDWTPPNWVADGAGHVDAPTIWAVLDCASGFYIGQDDDRPAGVTVQYEVNVLGPIVAGRPHVVVAWNGLHPESWDGRKRGAASCIFDADGTLLAQTNSFWVAPRS